MPDVSEVADILCVPKKPLALNEICTVAQKFHTAGLFSESQMDFYSGMADTRVIVCDECNDIRKLQVKCISHKTDAKDVALTKSRERRSLDKRLLEHLADSQHERFNLFCSTCYSLRLDQLSMLAQLNVARDDEIFSDIQLLTSRLHRYMRR